MSKPRESKPREFKPREYKPREFKPREYKPRDPKGRFIKSTSRIPFDLFGSRKTPATNPTQRYICSELDKGQGSTSRLTKLQSAIQLLKPSLETTSEEKETIQQSETTVELSEDTLISETEIERVVHPKLITSFHENLYQEVVISQVESEVVEIQQEIPFFTRVIPLSEPPFWNTIPEQNNQPLSLLNNMAEEEERVEDEEQDDEQTFRFPILDRAQNVVMKKHQSFNPTNLSWHVNRGPICIPI
jgi:hypothetical protein